MTKKITMSSPGKIHFLGEHVAVYGKPALLAAIDKRCSVTLTPRSDKRIEIISKNYNTTLSNPIEEVIEKTHEARRKWNEFIKTKNILLLTSITPHVLDYPFLAVGQNLLEYPKGMFQAGFSLTIESSIPVGSGCGSSSAIAVTISGIIRKFLGKSFDKHEILKTATSIEEFKHGTPSGGDPASVLYGGFVWYQKKDDEKVINPLSNTVSDEISKNFYLIDTGKPNETTGEMIAHVRELVEDNPSKAQKIFDDQEKLTDELVDAIEKNDSTSIIYIIKAAEKNLEGLGVVSPSVTKLISEIETVGGAAKISGGGGVTKGTGMALVFGENSNAIKKICEQMKLNVFQTKLGEEGLRVDDHNG